MKTNRVIDWWPILAFCCFAGFLVTLGIYVGGIAAFLTPNNGWGLVLVAIIALGLLTYMDEITKVFKNKLAFFLFTAASFCLGYLIIRGKMG